MKKYLLFITVLSTSVMAQPVLQGSNLAVAGLSATLNGGALVSPGTAGANQTWDFSTAVTSPVGVFKIAACGFTTCTSGFSSSQWCWDIPGSKVHYYNVSSSVCEQVGKDIPASNCSGGTNYTPNPKTIFSLPFSYTNSFSDTWLTTTSASGSNGGTYDGYGTLITPFGTHTNVIRITNTENSVYNNTIFLNSNPVYPLMVISTGSNSTSILSAVNVGVKENETENVFTVFPNPSNGKFSIIAQRAGATQLEVVNLLGETVYAADITSDNTEIDLSANAQGIYFIKFYTGQTVRTQKIVVQ